MPAVPTCTGATGLAGMLVLAIGCASLPPPPTTLPPDLDTTPLVHVYEPERLRQLLPYVSMTGVVESIRQLDDGDTHLHVRPDAPYRGLLSPVNRWFFHGRLVVEVVCSHPIRDDDVPPVCDGYTNRVAIPKRGEHIRVTGPLVRDGKHVGWNEIHPAYTIDAVR